jgi:TIR domain
MQRLFLSYNPQDLGLMQSLEAALRRKDPDARIFFAPKGLRPGGLWPEVQREIAEATAFLLLIGEKGIGPWQKFEYYDALDRRVTQPDFPVVLILLDGQPAPGLPFLRQIHWVITDDPPSEKSLAQVMDAVSGNSASPGELWRHFAPYRGLAAMTEADSGYFFGRERETIEVIRTLEGRPDKLPILLGDSGVGKSSIAQAGVLASLQRQSFPDNDSNAGPWPWALRDSRQWCFLNLKPGTEPLRALVESFMRTWQFDLTDARVLRQQAEWIEHLLGDKLSLSDLLDATEQRYQELGIAKPPAYFVYIDQGEELYLRAKERQRRRFSEVIAQGLADPRLYILMSMRTEFLAELQKDEPLYKAHRKIDVPPLREAQLREIVSRPAALLAAQFETLELVDIIMRRTAEDSVKDVGALPLLSYTLDDMWTRMVHRNDGVLRRSPLEPGYVLVERADVFLATHPDAEDQVRRIFTLKLATVHGAKPTRRRALRSEFSDEEWRLVSELADHPNRLLVTATPEGSETYAAVTHEAVLQRWGKVHEWIADEHEFLSWRTGLDAARRVWQATPDGSKDDTLLMGFALTQAQEWLARRTEDISTPERAFITNSIKYSEGTPAVRERTTFRKRPVPLPRGSKIFISYRRSDTGHVAGRIYDRLAREMPKNEIFFDVDAIPIGVNFKQHISSAVSSSAVMLVLVGGKWLSPSWKRSRWWFGLKLKEDFVQVEIESALDLGVPIVPLLVDSVVMPRVHDLPNSIAEFVLLNAAPIRSGRDFHNDMDQVLQTIMALRKRGISLKED